MPNSAADLIVLIVSPPAFAMPMIFAFEVCACSRNDEKSEVLMGWLMTPTTFPPERNSASLVPSTSDLPST